LASESGNDCRLGLLAFGDSITHGGGELQWGVALQSWALWVARGLGLPFTGYAVDGARADAVLREQIPAFEQRTAKPGARYDLGCLYIGVNDVRAPDWDAAAFERAYASALAFLASRCDRTLTLTAPLDLGRPRAGVKVRELNAAIMRAAPAAGALVVDLSDFRARNLVMADRVLEVLARDGASPAVWPSTLIDYETTRWKRLRGDATYLYRCAKDGFRAAVTRS
jgi:hypothetical protein